MAFKICSRCDARFECEKDSPKPCQCEGAPLSDEKLDHIKENYKDCLCLNCLHHLNQAL